MQRLCRSTVMRAPGSRCVVALPARLLSNELAIRPGAFCAVAANVCDNAGSRQVAEETSLLEKVARTWVCMAAAYYVYDLYSLTRDGLTGGPAVGENFGGRAFGEDFINYWSGAWLAW